jgi:hypothetical protein
MMLVRLVDDDRATLERTKPVLEALEPLLGAGFDADTRFHGTKDDFEWGHDLRYCINKAAALRSRTGSAAPLRASHAERYVDAQPVRESPRETLARFLK